MWVANARNAGGTYDPDNYGYPWRIVLHTIEGSASAGMIAGHAYPPHLWYDPPTRRLWQTVPLGRSAFALYQPGNSLHYTNKARALQVEISGRAAQTATWPQDWLTNIAIDVIVPICQWVAAHTGAQINLANVPPPGPDANSASEYAVQRLSELVWATVSMVCSHRHVPYNDHWDTGQLDVKRICEHARMIIGGLIVSTEGDKKLPDYLIRARPSGAVIGRYPNGGVQVLAYEELLYLQQKGIHIVDTNNENMENVRRNEFVH